MANLSLWTAPPLGVEEEEEEEQALALTMMAGYDDPAATAGFDDQRAAILRGYLIVTIAWAATFVVCQVIPWLGCVVKHCWPPFTPSKASECPICLDPIEVGSVAKRFRCNHAFHCACIERWLIHSHSAVCPVCRQPHRIFELHPELSLV